MEIGNQKYNFFTLEKNKDNNSDSFNEQNALILIEDKPINRRLKY